MRVLVSWCQLLQESGVTHSPCFLLPFFFFPFFPSYLLVVSENDWSAAQFPGEHLLTFGCESAKIITLQENQTKAKQKQFGSNVCVFWNYASKWFHKWTGLPPTQTSRLRHFKTYPRPKSVQVRNTGCGPSLAVHVADRGKYSIFQTFDGLVDGTT